MTIKPDKNHVFIFFCLLLLLSALMPLYYFGLNTPLWQAFAFHSPLFLIVLLDGVAYGRTFVLDEEGYTVCFMGFRKKYLWSELRTRRIQPYPKFAVRSRGDFPYRQVAIFSPRRFRKSRLIRPGLYRIFHPLSFMYINFYIPDPVVCGQTIHRRGRHYEADEQEFREKMKQWHVELEEWGV